MRRSVWWVAVCAAGVLFGCDDGGDGDVADVGGGGAGGAVADTGTDAAPDAGESGAEIRAPETCRFDWRGASGDGAPPPAPAEPCDALDDGACALPWPSDHYLAPMETWGGTGYRLSFGYDALPSNVTGSTPRPEPYWRFDGYGTGSQILTLFPNLDITNIPGEGAIEESLAPDAPLLIYRQDDDGLTRVPYFAELDVQEQDPAKRILFVRPAVILEPGARYFVAFRDLQTTEGAPITANESFAALRDGVIERPGYAQMLSLLEAEGVDRGSLVRAWWFVTRTDEVLHGPMLHMRDTAFEMVGPEGPEITVIEVEEYAQEEGGELPYNPHAWLRIKASVEAPHFMCRTDVVLDKQGWVFNEADDPFAPTPAGTRTAEFYIMVPHAARSGRPMRLVEYGHGQFGNNEEVWEPGWTRPCGRFDPRECGWWNTRIGDAHDLIFFGGELVGMAEEDFDENALTIVADLNLFPWFSDRLHQGLLEYLLLARAVRNRLAELPEIADRGVVVDDSEVLYSGISQGGIFGASVVALSPDIHRGHLGVPGQNYSMYLHRSRNFEPFFAVIRGVYTNTAEQAILLNMVQLLWDATENAGYLRKIADPFPGQPANAILATPVKGDRQVPPLSFEVAARTASLGIPVVGTYDTEREPYGLSTVSYPHSGSGLVLWGQGDDWAPPGNAPGPSVDPDPHEDLRHLDVHAAQLAHFLKTGEIIDTCGDGLCHFSEARPPPVD